MSIGREKEGEREKREGSSMFRDLVLTRFLIAAHGGATCGANKLPASTILNDSPLDRASRLYIPDLIFLAKHLTGCLSNNSSDIYRPIRVNSR